MEEKPLVPAKVFVFLIISYATFRISGMMRPTIQLPVTALVISLGVYIMVPFGKPNSTQRAISLIPFVACATSLIWLIEKLFH